MKLLEQEMKVVERNFEKQLRKQVEIDKIQMGFRPRKSTIDAIFSVRHMVEKYKAAERQLHMVFVDWKNHSIKYLKN